MSKILFILRKSQKKALYSHGSFGLSNSATFVVNQLIANGHNCKLVQVDDNSFIDREVVKFNPEIVVIEALWVVPQKFAELLRIHRNKKWIIRVHSKAPFLAMEGIAMDWLYGYHAVSQIYDNLRISCNNKQFNDELNVIKDYNSLYLPNIYRPSFDPCDPPDYVPRDSVIDVGCFGAIRPLKNQFLQAIAAIMFAKKLRRRMNFHINGTRPEQSGENVLRNLKGLFAGTAHKLIEHEWYSHEEFVKKVVPIMDIGMQVSFSESFNIITADFVYGGVPIVVSDDVDWMPQHTRVSPNSALAMAKKMYQLWQIRSGISARDNMVALNNYNYNATEKWERFLNE